MNYMFLNEKEAEIVLERSIAPRNCKLEVYTPINIPSFNISGKMITYSSPDSTYAVTKKLFDQAKKSILIGIYDLSADHMIACIKDALHRKVEVSLMLDIDSPNERDIFNTFIDLGVEAVEAPACPNTKVHFFPCCHEKVIVIDDQWTLIQSGNYSDRSIPFNELDGKPGVNFMVGNRDMGVAIDSKELAKFFTGILRSDMTLKSSKMRISALLENTLAAFGDMVGFLVAKPVVPTKLFSSKEFNHSNAINIQPVLSPDNYMEDVIILLKSAKKSIRIEQQYIRANQPQITKLLDAIKDARDNADGNFSVSIIVAPAIGEKNKTKLKSEIQLLEGMGFEVRLLSSKYFTHCHNKLVVVDDDKVLISSQNWSDSAVSKNREAGVIIHNEEMTKFYSEIFDFDWSVSEDFVTEMHLFETMQGLRTYDKTTEQISLNPADLQEV